MNKRTILTNEVLVYAYLGMFAAEIAMVTPFLFIEFWVGAFLMFWVILSIVVACCITERWCLMIVLDAEGILYKAPVPERTAIEVFQLSARSICLLHARELVGGIQSALFRPDEQALER